MGWGPQRVSGRVYETKPITAVFCFLWFRFVTFRFTFRFFIPLFGDPPTSGGLPTRLTRLGSPKGSEASKAWGHPWLGGPKAGEFPKA
jgi:hypothetical protein